MSTLATLRSDTRLLLDDVTASVSETRARWTNAQVDKFLTMAEMSYYQDIVDASEDFFLVSYKFNVGPSYQTGDRDIFKLPTDLDRIRLIESVDNSGTIYRQMSSLQEKPGLETANPNTVLGWLYGGTEATGQSLWRLIGDNILFKPDFGSNEELRIWYTQRITAMSANTDEPWGSHDNLKSFHDILPIQAAILGKAQKEEDPSTLIHLERKWHQRMVSGIEERVMSNVKCIRQLND